MTVIDKQVYSRIAAKKKRLDLAWLSPISESLKRELTVNYIYNSNALEGSTLTLAETRCIIEEYEKGEGG